MPDDQTPKLRDTIADMKAIQDSIGAWTRNGDGEWVRIEAKYLTSADRIIGQTINNLKTLAAKDAETKGKIEEAVKLLDDAELCRNSRCDLPTGTDDHLEDYGPSIELNETKYKRALALLTESEGE